jgi:hypothetical protein
MSKRSCCGSKKTKEGTPFMKHSDAKRQPEEVTPFQRFEELTKRLLAVPKKEADAKMEEIKRRKGKKPS